MSLINFEQNRISVYLIRLFKKINFVKWHIQLFDKGPKRFWAEFPLTVTLRNGLRFNVSDYLMTTDWLDNLFWAENLIKRIFSENANYNMIAFPLLRCKKKVKWNHRMLVNVTRHKLRKKSKFAQIRNKAR